MVYNSFLSTLKSNALLNSNIVAPAVVSSLPIDQTPIYISDTTNSPKMSVVDFLPIKPPPNALDILAKHESQALVPIKLVRLSETKELAPKSTITSKIVFGVSALGLYLLNK